METNKKKWLWLIGIIVIAVLVIIIVLNQPPKYFNKVIIEKDNYVKNNSEDKFIDTILYVGLQELKLKGIVVWVRPMTINKNYEGIELKARIIAGTGNQYLIEIGTKSKSQLIEYIPHELIHLQQMYNKELKVTKEYVIWRGDTLSPPPPYEDREWEQKAYKDSPSLSSNIKKKLYED